MADVYTCQTCGSKNPEYLEACTVCGVLDSRGTPPPTSPTSPATVPSTAAMISLKDEMTLLVEEYKTTLISMHHHEQTMWQLLSIFFVVAGAVLAFWVNADKTGSPNATLVLLLPAFLGVFTLMALLKHRFFWKNDSKRFRQLEKILGFRRSTQGHEALMKNWRRHFTSFHWAVVSIVLTVTGLLVVVWRSIPSNGPYFGFVDQTVFIVASVVAFVVVMLMGLVGNLMRRQAEKANKECHQYCGTVIPDERDLANFQYVLAEIQGSRVVLVAYVSAVLSSGALALTIVVFANQNPLSVIPGAVLVWSAWNLTRYLRYLRTVKGVTKRYITGQITGSLREILRSEVFDKEPRLWPFRER